MFYRADPVQGLGESSAFDLPMQTLLGMVQSAPPVGVFSQWGAAPSPNTWKDVAAESNYMLYPIGNAQLAAVQSAGGGPLGWVAVLSEHPIAEAAAERAFEKTPYAYFSREGIYRLDDGAVTPRIWFLTWAQLRDAGDVRGGSRSPVAAADELSGLLVFPMTFGKQASDRARPTMAFPAALALQVRSAPPAPPPLAPPPVPIPGPALPAPLPPASPAQPAPAQPTLAAGKVVAAFCWVGSAALAAYAGYVLVKKGKKRAPA